MLTKNPSHNNRPLSSRFRRKSAGVLAIALIAVLATSGCIPLGKPAILQGANVPRVFDNSDPAVLSDTTGTYLFGSTNNRKVPVRPVSSFYTTLSESEVQWANTPRDAMSTLPAWINRSRTEIWAPTVAKINNTYFMWFAARRTGATDTFNDQCIGRATATSPMGPYTPSAAPVYCGLAPDAGSNRWGRGALDPDVFRDASGSLYMVMALSRTQSNIGVVRLDATGQVVGGVNAKPTILASQSLPWHDGTIDAALRSDAFLENPSMIYEPRTKSYLLFYAAGQWYTSRYVTGFGRCSTPVGPCTLDTRAPFLKAGSNRSGVGGLTAFKDRAGAPRVAYASWTNGFEAQSGSVGEYSRQTHFSPLLIGPGTSPATQTIRLG